MAEAPEIIRFQIDMALESEGAVLDPAKVKEGVEEAMNNPAHGEYFTAWNEDGALMGSLLVTKEWSDWNSCDYWWIQSVYVRPEFRGNKVFTALYQEVRRMAKESGSTSLRLYVDHTNVRAQATYKKLGMDQSHYLMYEESL
jgi:Acetyltransferases